MTRSATIRGAVAAAIGKFDGPAISDPGRSTFALRMRLLRLQLRLTVAVCGV